MSLQHQMQIQRLKLQHKKSTAQLFSNLLGGAPVDALEVCIYTFGLSLTVGTCTPRALCRYARARALGSASLAPAR